MLKGSVLDILFIVIAIFVFAIISIVIYYCLSYINVNVANETINKSMLQTGMNSFGAVDMMMPVAMVGLIIVAILFAFLIPTHPVFLVFGIITLGIVVIIAAQFSNAFEQISTSPQLVNSTAGFPLTVRIFQNLPTIVLIGGAVLLIAMFAIWRGSRNEVLA